MKQNRHRRQKSKAAERELELEPERTEVREREKLTHTHTKRNLLASPTIAGGSFKNIFPKGIREKKGKEVCKSQIAAETV